MKNKLLFCGLLVLGIVLGWFYLSAGQIDGNILLNVRLPRLLLTLFTGMTLAGVGSVYQMMLNNPLAEPYILGVSSGAALGSVIAGLAGLFILMPVFGFAGALLTMLLVWLLAQKKGQFDKTRLLLSGIIVGMFLSAVISLIMYLFQQDAMLILGTLMGNLGHIFSATEYRFFLILTVVGLLVLVLIHHDSLTLDVMSEGDLYAGSVGIQVHRLRQRLFVLCSLLTGIVVAYAGIIGFVGLIIPHIVRLIVGTSQRKVYPLSLLGGGVFLLGCDFLAMHLTALELPVGVITAFIGCPFFVWLLLRKKA
ncbi:MAG TPA: iron ABC transporter permease [Candidatus Cloacimonadota bacterium]|nr:iron ABC transporter permease [Candidatus Cloacimonadota bacterium]